MTIIAIEEARATLRTRRLVHAVMTATEAESQTQIAKMLAEYGSTLTPEEECQGSWRQLLVCLQTGLFGQRYDRRAIAYLIRRKNESIEAAMARLDEALDWKVTDLVDRRLALQRRELYMRLASRMKQVASQA